MVYHFQIVCKSSFFKHVRFQYLYLPHNLYDLGIFVFNWVNVGFWNDIKLWNNMWHANIKFYILRIYWLSTVKFKANHTLTSANSQTNNIEREWWLWKQIFNESGFSFLITYLRTSFASKTNGCANSKFLLQSHILISFNT